MKQLKFETVKKRFVLILSIIFLGTISCTQTEEKVTSDDLVKVPSSTIHEAVFLGKTKDVKGHIAAKTDLNQKDAYGATALHVAATFSKTDIALLLIQGGANLNETNAEGSTPLHLAAFFGRTDIVKALLNKNVNLDVRNNYNVTALESVSGPFDEMKPIYDQLSKNLGPFGLKLDYDKLKLDRIVIAGLINKSSN